MIMVMVMLVAAGSAFAEAPKLGQDKGKVILSWDEFVKITGYDPAKKGSQVVTIPWKEVEKLLGVKKITRLSKSATVDLPWKDFKSLLESSINRRVRAEKIAAPPTDYIVASSVYDGKLTADGATFTLKLKVNVLREKGWKRIPVLPINVAIVKTTLPAGKKAYLNSTGRYYELLTSDSGMMDLTVEFRVKVKRSGGINTVAFSRVSRGSSMINLEVAGKEVDVKVHSSQSLATTADKGRTLVAATLPSGAGVSIAWERALKKVKVPTRMYAQTHTLVSVADAMLLCKATVNYNILHSAVRELKLTVPAGASVLTVACPQMQDWRVDKGVLTVVLAREVIGSYSLRVAYEQQARKLATVPVLVAKGVHRDRGFVGVVALANVEITAGKVKGATPLDVRQLPYAITSMTNQPVLMAFRYVGKDFSIPLAIRKHSEVSVLVTIADNVLYTIMQLNDGRRMTRAIFSVRNNRNQFLRVQMPAGAEIWSSAVGGKSVSPAKDESGNVLIPLIRSSARSSELASFPVELVYVETPDGVAPAAGKIRVNLPTLNVPVMQVMCEYYLPSEGSYIVKGGLFGKDKSGFSGPIRVVKNFAAKVAGRGAAVVRRNAPKQARKMQSRMDRQMRQKARAAGARPIRVKLPINGKLFKLQKILALPGDKLYFEVKYSGWKVAK